tara:strand:- start:634 stop:885 length:252 start_codon:yes stop_codon:yes gene_type:complete
MIESKKQELLESIERKHQMFKRELESHYDDLMFDSEDAEVERERMREMFARVIIDNDKYSSTDEEFKESMIAIANQWLDKKIK